MKRSVLILLIGLPVLLCLGCDRQPDATDSSEVGALPVLVSQAQEGPFSVERRFTGEVRARIELPVTVREPGEVVAVPAVGEGQQLTAGQVLIRLQSPELELELQEAQLDLDIAAAALARRQELADLGLAAKAEVEERQAAVERSRTRLERLLLRRELLTIRTPATGVLLADTLPVVGEWCPAGRELARVVDPSSLVVEVPVPVTWGDHAGTLEHALLETGDRSGEPIIADVGSLSAAVDPQQGGRILTLRPSSAGALVANATVVVRLVTARRERAVTVPLQALTTDDQGRLRVAVGPKPGQRSRMRWQTVVSGPDDGERVVIERGLEAGAWVVLSHGRRLSPFPIYLGVGQ